MLSPSHGQRQDFQIDWHDLVDEEDKNKKQKDIDLDQILEKFMEDAEMDVVDSSTLLPNADAAEDELEDIDLQEFLENDEEHDEEIELMFQDEEGEEEENLRVDIPESVPTTYYALDDDNEEYDHDLDDVLREFGLNNGEQDDEAYQKLQVQKNSELERRRRDLKNSLSTKQ